MASRAKGSSRSQAAKAGPLVRYVDAVPTRVHAVRACVWGVLRHVFVVVSRSWLPCHPRRVAFQLWCPRAAPFLLPQVLRGHELIFYASATEVRRQGLLPRLGSNCRTRCAAATATLTSHTHSLLLAAQDDDGETIDVEDAVVTSSGTQRLAMELTARVRVVGVFCGSAAVRLKLKPCCSCIAVTATLLLRRRPHPGRSFQPLPPPHALRAPRARCT